MTSRLAMWIGVSMLQLATRLVASVLLRRVGGVIDWQRGACVPTSPSSLQRGRRREHRRF